MEHTEIIRELGLWRWLVLFIVISTAPVINSVLRQWTDRKKERSTYDLLYEIRNLMRNQYTDNISLPMCEALLQPILDNASRFLSAKGKDILRNNNLSNRTVVSGNVQKIVDNMWQQNSAWLSHFKYKGRQLNEVINVSWKDEIAQLLIQSIYTAEGNEGERYMRNFESNIATEFENIRFNVMSVLQKI